MIIQFRPSFERLSGPQKMGLKDRERLGPERLGPECRTPQNKTLKTLFVKFSSRQKNIRELG
jgi:hypothetical protein